MNFDKESKEEFKKNVCVCVCVCVCRGGGKEEMLETKFLFFIGRWGDQGQQQKEV